MVDAERVRARLPGWTAVAFSLALLLPLTVPLMRGRVFIFDDLSNFHLPVRYLYANALRAGDSFLWTPALFSGFYLHGEGQVGMCHPLHLLLYGALPLTTAFNLELLFNYVFALGGMFLFLRRRLRLSPGAAASGGMLFAFSGFQLLHFHHMNLVAVTAHLPWLLLTLDRLMTADTPRDRAKAYIGPALVLASAILIGFPQGVWWILLGASAFMLLRARELGWRVLVPCAASLATGVMLGGIQLLPTLDVAAHSTRKEVPVDFALSFSLHPLNTLQLWAPYALENRVYSPVDYPFVHEFGIYSGALSLLTPIWLWIRRDALGRHRTLIRWTAGFAAVMFVLTLGRYGGLDVLLTKLPFLGSLRAPVRYIMLVQFALTILSAVALDDLIGLPGELRLPRRAVLLLCVPAMLSIATTLAINTGALSLGRSITPATMTAAMVGPALIAAITAALIATARTRLLLPLLVALVAIDLHQWGISYVKRASPQSIGSLTGLAPVPIPGARYDWSGEWADRPILKGHRMSWGYAGLYPSTTLSFDDIAFQRLAGVRGFVEHDASIVPVEGGADRVTLSGGSDNGGTVTLVSDRPGLIVVRTSTTEAKRLSLTERFDDGWMATIDGRGNVPLTALRGDFIACVVPAGVHRLEFRFRPRSFVYGSLLSGFGVLAAAVGALVMSRARA